MKPQIEEIGGGHISVPERKTDPIDVWIGEQYSIETVELFRAQVATDGAGALLSTVKLDIELFSAVRDETYNHDQFMEMRSLVKYLTALLGRAERVIAMPVKEDETPENTRPQVGPRVY